MAVTNVKIQIRKPGETGANSTYLFPRIRLTDIRNSADTEDICTTDGKIKSQYIQINSTTTIPTTGAGDARVPTEAAVSAYVAAAMVAGVASITGAAPITATTNGSTVSLSIATATSTTTGVVKVATMQQIYDAYNGSSANVITAQQFAALNAVIPFTSATGGTGTPDNIFALQGSTGLVMYESGHTASTTVNFSELQNPLFYNVTTSTLGTFVSSAGNSWVFKPAFTHGIGIDYDGTTIPAKTDIDGIATLFTVDNTMNNGIRLAFNPSSQKLYVDAQTASTARLGTVATKNSIATVTTAEANSAALVPTVGAVSACSAATVTAAQTAAQNVVNTFSAEVSTTLTSYLAYVTLT